MGAGGSTARGSVEDPFPIDPAQNANLDKLSLVAARLLTSSDIYELGKLGKGSCGDYVLFLKDELPKKLLPFVADISDVSGASGKRVTVYYQSPSGAIKSEKVRAKICDSLMNTMLRTVSIVVACLASMQIKATSREVVMASATPVTEEEKKPKAPGQIALPQYAYRQQPPAYGAYGAYQPGYGAYQPGYGAYPPALGYQMRGGGDDPAETQAALSWLHENGIIKSPLSVTALGSAELSQQVSGAPYTLHVLINEKQQVYLVLFTGTTSTPNVQQAFKLRFMSPVTVNGRKVLPIRMSAKGTTSSTVLMAGAINSEGVFVTFNGNERKSIYLTDLFAFIIDKINHVVFKPKDMYETSNSVGVANTFYNALERIPPAERVTMIGSLANISLLTGAPVVPGVAPLVRPALFRPPSRYTGAFAQSAAPAFAPLVKPPSSKGVELLGLFFQSFRKKLPRESNPAAVRAETLRGSLDPVSRTLLTRVCQDTYWLEPNLSKVLGWAAFEFLCTKNWKSFVNGSMSTEFLPDMATFISGLESIYNGDGVPKLEKLSSARGDTLDSYKFTGIENVAICKEGEVPRIGFREVQVGLKQLQELYAAHTAKMWKILNSLISIVADPATHTETIRLNDAMLNAKTSEAYVDERAAEARAALSDYYLNVEKIYVNTIRAVTIAT